MDPWRSVPSLSERVRDVQRGSLPTDEEVRNPLRTAAGLKCIRSHLQSSVAPWSTRATCLILRYRGNKAAEWRGTRDMIG